jgi:hypothetical protein
MIANWVLFVVCMVAIALAYAVGVAHGSKIILEQWLRSLPPSMREKK